MSRTPTRKANDPASSAETKANNSPRDHGSNEFIQAHNERMKVRQEIAVENEQRRRQAYLDYLGCQQDAREKAWEVVLDAYRAVVIAQVEAWSGPDGWPKYRDACEAWRRARNDYFYGSELRDKLASINDEYVKSEAEAKNRMRKRLAEIEIRYLARLKGAVGAINHHSVSSSMVQSMKMAIADLDASSWSPS